MNVLKNKLNPKNIYQWLGFSIIAFVTLAVYSPSLLHCPRSDQVLHLRHFAHQRSLQESAISNYDLNRNEKFSPGDYILFRPLLYMFMGYEKYFFGYKFYAWQMTGIDLHLLVVFWFLKICLESHAGLPAVAFAFLFALFYANMEMVIWNQVNAYLLALSLFLIALYHTFKLLKGCRDINKRIWGILIPLTFSIFIYEIFNFYALSIFMDFKTRYQT